MNKEQPKETLHPLRTFRLSLNSTNSNKKEVFEKQTQKYPVKTSSICLEKNIITTKNQLSISEIFEKKQSFNICSNNKNKKLNNKLKNKEKFYYSPDSSKGY